MTNDPKVLKNILTACFDGLAEQYSHIENPALSQEQTLSVVAEINDELIILLGQTLYDGETLH